jgi:hypothetical protein
MPEPRALRLTGVRQGYDSRAPSQSIPSLAGPDITADVPASSAEQNPNVQMVGRSGGRRRPGRGLPVCKGGVIICNGPPFEKGRNSKRWGLRQESCGRHFASRGGRRRWRPVRYTSFSPRNYSPPAGPFDHPTNQEDDASKDTPGIRDEIRNLFCGRLPKALTVGRTKRPGRPDR